MSQNAILTKLAAWLKTPPQNEAYVVYLHVEIRKYLDHVDPAPSGTFPVLRMYCDWPVHVVLARSSAAKNLLGAVGAALAARGTQEERDKAAKAIFDRFSLSQFQQELRQFLKIASLPLRLVDDGAWRGNFLKHYASVVSDCPFAFNGNATDPRAITKATLQINPAMQSVKGDGVVNVPWKWELEFADGSTKTFSYTYAYAA